MNINHRVNKNRSSFYTAVENNNVEMIKIFIDYADDHDIIIDINEKIMNDNIVDSSLLMAVRNNNVEIIQQLIDYAHRHNIILDINKNDLIKISSKENKEATNLLIKYCKEHNIDINEDMSNVIIIKGI